jgi:hypothetical protein
MNKLTVRKWIKSQLFEIKLELEGKKGVVYEPEIDKSEGSVREVFAILFEDGLMKFSPLHTISQT